MIHVSVSVSISVSFFVSVSVIELLSRVFLCIGVVLEKKDMIGSLSEWLK